MLEIGNRVLVNQNLKLEIMKKLIAAVILSVFTLGTLVASANPVLQQDTSKHKMKRDTSMKKDTSTKHRK